MTKIVFFFSPYIIGEISTQVELVNYMEVKRWKANMKLKFT